MIKIIDLYIINHVFLWIYNFLIEVFFFILNKTMKIYSCMYHGHIVLKQKLLESNLKP